MWIGNILDHGLVQLCPHYIDETEHQMFARAGEGGRGKEPPLGPRLLAPGSRIMSVLARHTVSYRAVAPGGDCLYTPQSQCPDALRLLPVEVTSLETQWGIKG